MRIEGPRGTDSSARTLMVSTPVILRLSTPARCCQEPTAPADGMLDTASTCNAPLVRIPVRRVEIAMRLEAEVLFIKVSQLGVYFASKDALMA